MTNKFDSNKNYQIRKLYKVIQIRKKKEIIKQTKKQNISNTIWME